MLVRRLAGKHAAAGRALPCLCSHDKSHLGAPDGLASTACLQQSTILGDQLSRGRSVWGKMLSRTSCLASAGGLALVLYLNTLQAGFTFDDNFAVARLAAALQQLLQTEHD